MGPCMGRIRTVKPELLTHEDLFMLEKETGLPIRLAFVGLFTVCDREGRFKWQPNRIKLAVLPYDELDFSRVLHALETRGFIRMYSVNDEIFGHIPTWAKHQVINNRESASEIPEPNEISYISMPLTRAQRVIDATSTPLVHAPVEGKGKEGKGSGKENIAPAAADAELFPGVDAQVIADFKRLRKQKRSAVTMTAMLSIQKEAAKAGLSLNDALLLCCARGWQGFNADWVTGQAASAKSNMHVNHLDHTSSKRAMEESMRKHGITEIPEGEIEF